MATNNEITTKFKVDISEFKKNITEANKDIKLANAQFKAAAAGMDDWKKSSDGLNAKLTQLNTIYDKQKTKLQAYSRQLEVVENAEEENKRRVALLTTEYEKAVQQYGENSTEAKKYAKALNETEKEQIANHNEAERLRTTLANQQGTVNGIERDMRAYATQLESVESESRQAETATGRLTAEISQQENDLERAKAKYKEMVLAQQDGTEEARELAQEITRLSTKLQENRSDLDRASNAADELDRSLDQVDTERATEGFTVMKGALASLVADGIRAGIEGFKNLARASIEYESAFTNVKKTVDGTPEQLDALDKSIRNMAKKMPQSAAEIAEVAAAAGQLGIKTDDISEFTKTMIMLGDSTNLSSEEAASALAKFANVTNMSAKDYSKLGSVIVDLGNNFATTEKDIVEMGTRLASAGSQVGMSQAEIMGFSAALSSVGIEAEAGGTAFSKLLINMQVATEKGGKKLEEFAGVAGMSASEFQRAFKDDATGAVQAFIAGLADSEKSGKSAISVLDDMGIKEVRLRDTILRAANAKGVFTDAVNVGKKAWGQDAALTNEANQRYKTTESQLKIMKNNFIDLGLTLFDRFQPAIQAVIKSLTALANNKPALVALTAAVTALVGAFAVTKIVQFGSALKGAMTVIKESAVVTKLLSAATRLSTTATAANTTATVAGTAATSGATAATKLLALAQKATPWGLALAGITAVVGALVLFSQRNSESTRKLKEEAAAIKESTDRQKELTKAKKDAIASGVAETDYHARLKNELMSITTENGRVKKGYEDRANFIMGQLNSAYGTELKAVNGVISKYKEQMNTIDQLIAKKRAKIIVDAGEQAYTNAIQKQAAAYDYLAKREEAYTAAKQKQTAIRESLVARLGVSEEKASQMALKRLSKDEELTVKNYEKKEKEAKNYTQTIADQEKLMSLLQEGSAESIAKINKTVSESYRQNGETVRISTQKQIEIEQKKYKDLIALYKKTGDETYKEQAKSSKRKLDELNKALDSQKSTTRSKGNERVRLASEIEGQIVGAIRNKQGDYKRAGETNANAHNSGITSKKGAAKSAGQSLATSGKSGAQGLSGSFKSTGSTLGTQLNTGLSSKSGSLKTTGGKLGTSGIAGFKSKDFRGAGAAGAQGIASGAAGKESTVGSIFRNLGTTALAWFKKKLGISSPSKEFIKATGFIIDGIVVSAKSGEKDVAKSMVSLAEKAVDSFKTAVGDLEITPEITGVNVGKIEGAANSLRQGTQNLINGMGGGALAAQGAYSNVNNFTQVINAPKAPSRIDLYRQTRNLLNLKGGF